MPPSLPSPGPAPLAKLVTQRSRRVDKSITSEEKLSVRQVAAARLAREKLVSGEATELVVQTADERVEAVRVKVDRARAKRKGKAVHGPDEGDPLSQLQITPGALFMLRLDEMLEFYACQRVEQNVEISIEINGARVPGEGEVKLMSRLKQNAAAARSESHAVVGSDSDLKLLAMAAGVDCYVFSNEERLPPRSGFAGGMLTFSTRAFRETFLRKQLPGLSDAQLREVQRDFLLLCFMSGNDYLPCVGQFALERSWPAYRALRKTGALRKRPIVRDDRTIDRGALGLVLGEMLLRFGVVTKAACSAELDAAAALDSELGDGRATGAARQLAAGCGGGCAEECQRGVGGAGIRGNRVLAAHARAMADEAMADGGGMGALNRLLLSYGQPVVTRADCVYTLPPEGGWKCSVRLGPVQGLTTKDVESTSVAKSSKGAARADVAADLYFRLQEFEAQALAQARRPEQEGQAEQQGGGRARRPSPRMWPLPRHRRRRRR